MLVRPSSKTTCQNSEIRRKKPPSFYIDRFHEANNQIKWIALLDPSLPRPETPLAYLEARRGSCNDLKTYAGSQRCGIGRAMMEMCLKDEEITNDGGYNPLLNYWIEDELAKPARDLCKTIINVSCKPYERTPPIACKMYMDVASTTGYHMIFVQSPDPSIDRYHRYKIEIAKEIFENNHETFLEEKGDDWFFCKCKPDELQKCIGNKR